MAGRRHADRRLCLRVSGRQPGAGALLGQADAIFGVLPGGLELRVVDPQRIFRWASNRDGGLVDARV